MRLALRHTTAAVVAIASMTCVAAAEAPKAPAVEQAVLKSPTSAPAWLAVAKYHDKLGEVSPAVLAYARYLTLAGEMDDAKAPAASRLWELAVPREDQPLPPVRASNGEKDVWWGTDNMLHTVLSHRHEGRLAGMNDAELFATILQGLTFFTKTMNDNGQANPMWSKLGIPYFVEAYESENMSALACEVTKLHGAPETKAWLDANRGDVERFLAWSKAWKPQAAPAP
jgi:hypothetical protein